MSSKHSCVVIHSVRENGQKFRPSDWIDRISSNSAGFGQDRRLRYTSLVHPGMIDGERCLVVDVELAERQPGMFQYIMDFAHSNHLKMDRVEHC